MPLWLFHSWMVNGISISPFFLGLQRILHHCGIADLRLSILAVNRFQPYPSDGSSTVFCNVIETSGIFWQPVWKQLVSLTLYLTMPSSAADICL